MKTIKSFSMNFLACAMAVLAASAGTAGAALTVPQINPGSGFVGSGTGTACNVDTPPVISVTSTGNAAVWVNFRYKGATWRLPMTNGVTPFCLKMPVIPAGTVEYRIEGGTAFDPYSSTNAVEAKPSSSTYYSYINTATLGNDRKPNMQTWYNNVFYPNYDNGDIYSNPIDADWRASKLSMNPYAAELFRNLQSEIVSLWMVVRLKTELLKPENAMPLTVRLVTPVPVAKPPLKSLNGKNVVLSAPAPTNVTSWTLDRSIVAAIG